MDVLNENLEKMYVADRCVTNLNTAINRMAKSEDVHKLAMEAAQAEIDVFIVLYENQASETEILSRLISAMNCYQDAGEIIHEFIILLVISEITSNPGIREWATETLEHIYD